MQLDPIRKALEQVLRQSICSILVTVISPQSADKSLICRFKSAMVSHSSG